MARVLTGAVVLNGVDDEYWPWSDETVQRTFNIRSILDEGQPVDPLSIEPTGWGGEVRAELDLTPSVDDSGRISLQGEARLYEGDTENTQDLEDSRTVNIVIPPGAFARRTIGLYSRGLGGGDRATFSMFLFNRKLEDDEQ
jgi:hypothetical protein